MTDSDLKIMKWGIEQLGDYKRMGVKDKNDKALHLLLNLSLCFSLSMSLSTSTEAIHLSRVDY